MGKGGCQTSLADLGDAAAPDSSVLGFGAIISAIQLITSSRWAEDQIDPARNGKPERNGDPSTAVRRPSAHDRPRDGKIPWHVVRQHNTASSCWMVVRNKVSVRRGGQSPVRSALHRLLLLGWPPHLAFTVLECTAQVYDVTDFAPQHPGGSAILAYGGRDASDVFAAFHASRTWSKLKEFCIGEVEVRPACTAESSCNQSFSM